MDLSLYLTGMRHVASGLLGTTPKRKYSEFLFRSNQLGTCVYREYIYTLGMIR